MRRLTLVLSIMGLAAAAHAQPQPVPKPAAPLPGCASAESRQFDFWVGRWTVTPTQRPDRKVAESLIEKLYGGCAIRENWMPINGPRGGSLSSYVPAEKGWKQRWVDENGATVDFKGGWDGKAMVLTGVWPQPGKPNQLTRMTYTKGADGSVRQQGQTSDDKGKTWQPGFDFTYRPMT